MKEYKFDDYDGKKYSFEGYYAVISNYEKINFYNDNDEYLGNVITDDMESCIRDLENGANPIEDQWEDGAGTTLRIEGWTNE
ncbi:hypothetical protein [[Eubacterium] hominis]|uniref:hypothetical protein n=1 Tax=[Eubacterium] hominis TaxID=2764325 RepID=UPI0022E3A006